MEDRFGWRREAGARWEVRDGRLIGDDGAIDLGPAADPQRWPDEDFSRAKSQRANPKIAEDRESLPGKGIIRQIIPDLIERHNDRSAFLSELGKNGIELAMTGSNACYRINYVDGEGRTATEDVRPSVLRKWSTAKLRDRFDTLPEKFGTTSVTPQKVTGQQIDRIRFASEKAAFQGRFNRVVSALRKAPGKTDNDQIAAARAASAFPSFEEWMAGARPGDPAELLAHATGTGVVCAPEAGAASSSLAVVRDEYFRGRRIGEKVVYTEKAAGASSTRVTDCGDVVIITGPPSDAAIRLSLRLLRERGAEAVVATGFSRRDYARVRKIAAQMGLEVVEPKRPKMPRPLPAQEPVDRQSLPGPKVPARPAPEGVPEKETAPPPNEYDHLPSRPSSPPPPAPAPEDKPIKPPMRPPWPNILGPDWGR